MTYRDNLLAILSNSHEIWSNVRELNGVSLDNGFLFGISKGVSVAFG